MTPKLLPPAPSPPNKDNWDTKEDKSLTEDDGVTPLYRSTPLLSTASVCPLSVLFPSALSSSSTRLHLSIFFRHFHPHQTPRVFLIALLYVLLSGLTDVIIYMSPHHIFLPLIRSTSAIFYSYTPTHPLPLYFTHIYFYLYIYLLSLTFSLFSLSLTLCLSIFLLNAIFCWPLTNFLTLYYLILHSLTILLSISLVHSLSLSLSYIEHPPSLSLLFPVTNSIAALIDRNV